MHPKIIRHMNLHEYWNNVRKALAKTKRQSFSFNSNLKEE